jgi:uncharacterized protein
MKKKGGGVNGYILLFASWAHAAGFDCTKASTLVEKAICSDSELSKLDDLLMISYKEALGQHFRHR